MQMMTTTQNIPFSLTAPPPASGRLVLVAISILPL
jgi:hypothetical protein